MASTYQMQGGNTFREYFLLFSMMLQLLVHGFLWFIAGFMRVFYTPLWVYYRLKKPARIPAVYEPAFYYTAEVLAEKIRGGVLSSAYVVGLYVNRVKEVNPILNAVVEDRFELAAKEAEHVDDFLKNTQLDAEALKERYPLLGVPLTVKESIGVEGMSNGCGVVGSGRGKCEEDADVVKQLKSAGAVVILVSNTPEMCINWETNNGVTGRTLNPYDTRRTCGGSSGGEAVLLASCGSIMGIGSDLVGSLRLPPAFCGIYGHKPTSRIVSVRGHFPLEDYADMDYDSFQRTCLTFGPMTRYAKDLPFLLNVMLLPEMKGHVNLKQERDPKMIKIYYVERVDNFLTSKIDEEIVQGIRKVVDFLENEGLPTQKIHLEKMSDIVDTTFVPLLSIVEFPGVFRYNKSIIAETLKTLCCVSDVTPNSIFHECLISASKLSSHKRYEEHMRLLQELKSDLLEVLGQDGVLIHPTFPNVAHFHGQIYSRTVDSCYMALFSNMGLPVTACPIGLNSQGMPMSIQVISNEYNDGLCFAIAELLERCYGGWIPPRYARIRDV